MNEAAGGKSSMICITGDTHGDFRRFSNRMFPQQDEMTKEDHVIITGDFGGVWFGRDDRLYQKAERHDLDELDQRSFTTLFIPGNHENYDRLMSDEFPEIRWNGGMVRQIRPSVLMLMRGEMYTINGLKVFAFGGAASHDVSDGILDGDDPEWKKKAKKLQRQGKIFFRVKGRSWWPQEMPSEEEMQHGLETLEENGWKADIVITHCAPASLLPLLGIPGGNDLNKYLEEIHVKIDYKKWFFGHYHRNRILNDKDIMLYEKIVILA